MHHVGAGVYLEEDFVCCCTEPLTLLSISLLPCDKI